MNTKLNRKNFLYSLLGVLGLATFAKIPVEAAPQTSDVKKAALTPRPDTLQNKVTCAALTAYLEPLIIPRHEGLMTHSIAIPDPEAQKAIASGKLPELWAWILTQIPPDSTPDGYGPCLDIRDGEYTAGWFVGFVSEAFGRQPKYPDGPIGGGATICRVNIDWLYCPIERCWSPCNV